MGILSKLTLGLANSLMPNVDDNDLKDAKGLSGLLSGPNSITKMAKKAIFNYPVLVSESVYGYSTKYVEGIVKYSGELKSLKRYKDNVKEVVAGQDCGIQMKEYNDIHVGDVIESYEEIEIKRTLKKS